MKWVLELTLWYWHTIKYYILYTCILNCVLHTFSYTSTCTNFESCFFSPKSSPSHIQIVSILVFSSLCLLIQQNSCGKINAIGNVYKNTVGKGTGKEEWQKFCVRERNLVCSGITEEVRCWVVFLHHLKECHKMC